MAIGILGGGMSGLSAAYYLLQRHGVPATVYEATNRLGGWIRTEQLKDKKTNTEFRFEAGPRTLRPKGVPGANTLELIEQLGIPITGIPSKHAAARNRMIYAKGQLCLLPNSLLSIFKQTPPFSKPLILSLLSDLIAPRKRAKHNDEPIFEFIQRRFGTELATYAISAMICGICAGDAKQISVRFLMNDLYDIEQRYGGVAKGLFAAKLLGSNKNKQEEISSALYKLSKRKKWSMYSLEEGMEALPSRLAAYLQDHDVQIQLKNDCEDIKFDGRGALLHFNDKQIALKHVISAMPSFKLASCVKDMHPSLAAQLLEIPYVNVAVVNLQYNTANLLQQQAFGFLVPPVEKLPILGVIFDSCCFDMQGNTVLTVMMGGHWFEQHFGQQPTPKQLLDTALEQVRKILQITVEPEKSRVHVLHNCIPQYTVGHKERVASIRKYIQQYKLPLSLCGAAYDGVGLNDVILSARRQVENLPDSIFTNYL